MKKLNLFCLISLILFASCEKFLDERISKTSTVPATVEDLQSLLDNGSKINMGNYPVFIETGTDDFQISSEAFANLSTFNKEIYTYKNPESYPTATEIALWRNPYYSVSLANTVLDELPRVRASKGLDFNHIKGQAQFHRAYVHFMMAQVYCGPYDKMTAHNELGIPLRLSADINVKSKRSTIAETYESIISDLKEAATLLPIDVSVMTRPSKVAALAALSKVYLTMGDYENTARYAEQALAFYSTLIDFNDVNVNANFPFPQMNKETIFFAYSSGTAMLNATRSSYINKDLMSLYDLNDMRLKAYFTFEKNGEYTFKGHYLGFGGSAFFCGLTTSELLLNLAESNVRMNKLSASNANLNQLLIHRIEKKYYNPIQINDQGMLLIAVLNERRKELIRRGVRWSDLRRLNKEDKFRKTISRKLKINGQDKVFELFPNDQNYIYKIPIEVISMTGMKQN